MEARGMKTEKKGVSSFSLIFSKSNPRNSSSTNQNMSKISSISKGGYVRKLDLVLILISLVTCVLDLLTDALVAGQYFINENFTWFSLTLLWLVGPFVTVQAFSFRWLAADGKLIGWKSFVVNCFYFQPIERYISTFRAGLKAHKSKGEELVQDYLYQQNDVCMLRLFEAFLESAPQLSLQAYIILCTDHMHWLTGVSAMISLMALGWAVATYTHGLRRAYKQEYHVRWPALVLQTFWHISMTAARIAALVAFASVFKAWVFLAVGIHWAMMTAWLILQSTDFCPSRVEEILFDAVMALIYCFSFLNLKEGPTRVRMAIYYAVILAENILLVGIWYPFRLRHVWYNQLLLSLVFVAFAIGGLCLLLYYGFFHPTGTHPIFEKSFSSEAPATPETKALPKNKISRVTLMPQQTSTVYLPRRSMLKLNNDILYKEVFTPSKFSPIKPMSELRTHRKPIYADCTGLNLNGSSAYQHYSVDATACMGQVSLCRSLEGTGVDLSQCTPLSRELFPAGYDNDDEPEHCVLSQTCLEADKETKLIHSNQTF